MIDPRSIGNRLNASPSRRSTPRRRRASAARRRQEGRSRRQRERQSAARGLAIGQVAGPFASAACGRGPSAGRRRRSARVRARPDGARHNRRQRQRSCRPIGFRRSHAAVARILEKAIGALVAPCRRSDHVEEQARMLARRQRHVEQVDAGAPGRRPVHALSSALRRTISSSRTSAIASARSAFSTRACRIEAAEVRLDRDVIGLVVHRLALCPPSRG